MHPEMIEIRKRLTTAKDTYTNAKTHAQNTLRGIVGDGTGDKRVLAAAWALARDFGFRLELHKPLPKAEAETEAQDQK